MAKAKGISLAAGAAAPRLPARRASRSSRWPASTSAGSSAAPSSSRSSSPSTASAATSYDGILEPGLHPGAGRRRGRGGRLRAHQLRHRHALRRHRPEDPPCPRHRLTSPARARRLAPTTSPRATSSSPRSIATEHRPGGIADGQVGELEVLHIPRPRPGRRPTPSRSGSGSGFWIAPRLGRRWSALLGRPRARCCRSRTPTRCRRALKCSAERRPTGSAPTASGRDMLLPHHLGRPGLAHRRRHRHPLRPDRRRASSASSPASSRAAPSGFLMGAMDVLLAFPALLLALAIITFTNNRSVAVISLAIGIVSIAPIARLVRASTLVFTPARVRAGVANPRGQQRPDHRARRSCPTSCCRCCRSPSSAWPSPSRPRAAWPSSACRSHRRPPPGAA